MATRMGVIFGETKAECGMILEVCDRRYHHELTVVTFHKERIETARILEHCMSGKYCCSGRRIKVTGHMEDAAEHWDTFGSDLPDSRHFQK